MKKWTYILFLLPLYFLIGCKVDAGMKTPYVSYYKGNNTLLYFVKPRTLSIDTKNNVKIDFTFTDNIKPDTVIANFTILGNQKPSNPNFEIILPSGKIIHLNYLEIIFNDIDKKGRITRYSCCLSKNNFLDMMKEKEYFFLIKDSNNKEYKYFMNKKNIRRWTKFNKYSFELLRDKFS